MKKRKSRDKADRKHMHKALVRIAGDHRRRGSGMDDYFSKLDFATVLPVTVPRSLRGIVHVRRGCMQFTTYLKWAYWEGAVFPRPMYTARPLFAMLRKEALP